MLIDADLWWINDDLGIGKTLISIKYFIDKVSANIRPLLLVVKGPVKIVNHKQIVTMMNTRY